jgi:hypothetical protein
MKIGCHCGATIFDQTDDLPHKGHLVPDQVWDATWDAMDDKVIVPLVKGAINKEAASDLLWDVISRASRLMWQCRECGRLYIDDEQGVLHCFVPSDDKTSREILRSRGKT